METVFDKPLDKAVADLKNTTVQASFNGTNQTWAGQSYHDMLTITPGKWLIVCDFAGNMGLIICKGNISTAGNIFGDVTSGGVAFANVSSTTTVKVYMNTADTANYTIYRPYFTAVKLI